MRRGHPLLWAGLGIGVTLLAAVAMLFATTIFTPPPRPETGSSAGCLPPIAEDNGEASGTPQDQLAALDDEQRGIVQAIIAIGKQRQMPPRAWQIAIQAGKTESNLRNLTHGDRDSLGIFQMRPSMGWGTVEQVTNVEYQVNKFYTVLVDTVPGWEQMRPGDAAQRVERSAFPQRYHQWEGLAVLAIEQLGHTTNPAGCAPPPPPSELASRVLAYAHAQLGKPYLWGGNGPDAFDCSGLVQQAYLTVGISLPRNTVPQYRAGQPIPVDQAAPGDLLFWGYGRQPGGVHHVGIALGDGKVLHAPQDNDVIKISPIWDSGELMPHAIRPQANPRA